MYVQYDTLVVRDTVATDAKQLVICWNDGAVMAHAGFPKVLGTTEEILVHPHFSVEQNLF